LKEGKYYFDLFFQDHNVSTPTNFTELVNYFRSTEDICDRKPLLCEALRRDLLHTGLFYEGITAWRNAFGAENVLILDMEESNYDKMKKISSLMGDYLLEHEYPWEILGNISKSFSNTLYSGRSSGMIEHRQSFLWLYRYFHPHNNIALAEEIDADWPFQWNQHSLKSM
jgi:hypothetical protein